jgi:hypothetical protein
MYRAWRVLWCPTENIYTWWLPKNIFNNQLQTAEKGWLLATRRKLEAVTKCYRRPQNGQTLSHGKSEFIQNLDLKRRRKQHKQFTWKLLGGWEYNRKRADWTNLAPDIKG